MTKELTEPAACNALVGRWHERQDVARLLESGRPLVIKVSNSSFSLFGGGDEEPSLQLSEPELLPFLESWFPQFRCLLQAFVDRRVELARGDLAHLWPATAAPGRGPWPGVDVKRTVDAEGRSYDWTGWKPGESGAVK